MTTVGELRHRITFQSLTRTADAIGGAVSSWADVVTVWAEIKPVGAAERYFSQRLETNVTHKVRMRARADVDAKMRFTFKGRIFEVKGVVADLERKDFQTVLAEEGVAS